MLEEGDGIWRINGGGRRKIEDCLRRVAQYGGLLEEAGEDSGFGVWGLQGVDQYRGGVWGLGFRVDG